jgi:hypothetical protein
MEKSRIKAHDESPSIGGITQESMYYYMISRAFIPPWSLVMTKPETLGPDAPW